MLVAYLILRVVALALLDIAQNHSKYIKHQSSIYIRLYRASFKFWNSYEQDTAASRFSSQTHHFLRFTILLSWRWNIMDSIIKPNVSLFKRLLFYYCFSFVFSCFQVMHFFCSWRALLLGAASMGAPPLEFKESVIFTFELTDFHASLFEDVFVSFFLTMRIFFEPCALGWRSRYRLPYVLIDIVFSWVFLVFNFETYSAD